MSKDLTLEEILQLKDDPKINLNLTTKDLDFLRFYAFKRDLFNIRELSDGEYDVVKAMLDRIFVAYTASQESVYCKLIGYGAKVDTSRKEQSKLLDYLRELEENLNNAGRNDEED